VEINETVFSYGPGGLSVMDIDTYLNRNSFRDNYELILDLPNEEDAMSQCLAKSWGKYKPTSNNCATPVQACFKSIGLDLGDQLLPQDLGMELLNMGMVQHVLYFPAQQSRPPSWKMAPWAW
jgi:hypothetical protein